MAIEDSPSPAASSGAEPRAPLLARLRTATRWDLAVIGGGATGLGVALDAAARGLSVVLLESHDFAQGTSSRATKLAHGGVRYLAQGDIGLVREALRERGAMLANAPHLVQRVPLIMPSYQWWSTGFYGAGLKAYDALAGSRGIGRTEFLSAARTRELLPGVQTRGLSGGVKYWDGQFDDARLALALARTAADRGALVVNHCPVEALHHEGGRITGLRARDTETGETFELQTRCVVNATGVWVDGVRDLDRAPGDGAGSPMVSPSQGVHLVVDASFLPGDHALLVPRTADGRVLFGVPWLGHVVLGTTDTPRQDIVREPAPFAEEVAFILDESARVLARAPRREDVRSVWVGLRPLVRPGAGQRDDEPGTTKALSREHTVVVARSGLVTVTGGKWTTYRAMAEDVLSQAMQAGLLPQRPTGVTERLPLRGAAPGRPLSEPPGEHLYGTEATALRSMPGADRWLWRMEAPGLRGPRGLSEAMVRFAIRQEMARSLEDVLARRCRLLFLDARRAAALAPDVAALLRQERGPGYDAAADLAAFRTLAEGYARLP